jgi:hypothetical protein
LFVISKATEERNRRIRNRIRNTEHDPKQDPEQDPKQNPIRNRIRIRNPMLDPRIRIRLKISQIRNTSLGAVLQIIAEQNPDSSQNVTVDPEL